MSQKPRLTVVLEGGMVQAILGPPDWEVAIIDYDVEATDDYRVADIAQSDGVPVKALLDITRTVQNPVVEESVWSVLDARG